MGPKDVTQDGHQDEITGELDPEEEFEFLEQLLQVKLQIFKSLLFDLI